jgi:pantetheine-phosphate adenylyltransferase
MIFGTVVLAVAKDTHKKSMFSVDERVDMASEALANERGVVVEGFEGLLVDYVKRRGAKVILRGLRAVSDFDFEFQMALMNRRMAREVETVFLMTDFKWLYISSTIIKEAVRAGGDVRGLVPDAVLSKLYTRCGRELPG